ncbi:chitinase [Cystobacter fuscus DSM 2262]|uniref:Chitinase n=1 Tax=Cystobacter fuscus (strain ATCC 25194 / DSM 2262 / NBRC 100088 / M29) TaxID=1242864 RepID=S9QQ18_CYSF2|nr:myxosortase-dependent M36 family metallopeptidase [Cystobacter fuscus]EPX58683.1 chitinase [Cystobacter fuscus DSM 2262]
MTRLVFKWSSLALALASTGATARDLPNYEVLQDAPPSSLRAAPSPGTSPRLGKTLGARVTHRDEQRDLPTFVWANGRKSEARSLRTPLAGMKPDQAAGEQLAEYLSLYGHKSLTEAGASVASVSRDARGVSVVTFAQKVDGVEVFRQGLKVILDANNEVVALSGNLSPYASATTSAARVSSLRHQLTAPQAIALAYQDLTGASLDGSLLTRASVRADDNDAYTHYQLAPYARPLAEGLVIPARARRVFFPMAKGLVPAYYLELNTAPAESSESDYYAYVVSAADGRLLMRNNLTAHADFTYRVWAETTPPYLPLDGPAGGVATPHPTGKPFTFAPPAFVAPSLVTLQNAPFSKNDPWLADGATQTQGNNVDAYADLVAPDGFSQGDLRATVTAPGVFDRTMDLSIQPYANPEQIQAATTQLFYVNNWLHDWFYDVGFDEASGNAQKDNFGRGGLGGDAIQAQAQDYSGRNNANMSTPADGASPRMQMYIFDNLDTHLETSVSGGTTRKYPVGTVAAGPLEYNLSAEVVLTASGTPSDTKACAPLTNAAEVAGKIALVDRSTSTSCTIPQQIKNAQNAGAIGVLWVNTVDVVQSSGSKDASITIPTQIVTRTTGQEIKAALPGLTARLYSVRFLDPDGTIDNGIVAHEWGHYISNRLIWNGSGLTNNQGRSMGEGWADFTALLMMTRPEDINVPSNANWNGAYAAAEYATRGGMSDDSTFFGIRRVTYSADMSKNALTFKHISNAETLPTSAPISPFSTNAEYHNSGEIWATLLWDCYVALLRAHPFQEAQQRMKQYLVNGYKLTPAMPTFLEARDALIAAAYALDPADGQRFWSAFARRGAGVGAKAPDRLSTTHVGVVESYDTTADVAVVSISVDAPTQACDGDAILDNGEMGQLRIKVRNLGPTRTEGTTATVTSPTFGVTLGNGGQVQVPALDVQQEAEVTVPVSLQGATMRQWLNFVVTTHQGQLKRPGDRTGTLTVMANYDEEPESQRLEDVQSSNPPWTFTHDDRLDNVDWEVFQYPTVTNNLFYAVNEDGPSDMRLTTPPLLVSATEPFVLKFKQAWSFEWTPASSTNPKDIYYDGAVIELSEDDGQTWVDVGQSLYTATLESAEDNLNPLDGRKAISGKSPGFPALIPATLDLGTAYAGKTVRLRFRVGSDINTGADGWLVDDLEFSGITNTPFTKVLEDDNVCVSPQAPVISAGPDLQVGERAKLTLQGSAKDPNGGSLTYTWTQVSGPTVTLTGANTLTPSFVAPEVTASTNLVLRLSVTNKSSTVTDTVTVTVTNVNRAPTVNAGLAGIVDERSSYTLMGSASDEDGDKLTYYWVQQSGTPVALSNALTPQATFTAPEVTLDETLTFLLLVSDGQTTTRASVDVTVKNVNRAPTAHAGDALTVEEGAQAKLNGTASADPDGDTLSYTWTQVEGSPVTLTGADTATPSFIAPDVDAQTTLRFSLVVKDGSLDSEPAFVSVTVTPKPVTNPEPQPNPDPEPQPQPEPPKCGCSTGAEAPLGLLGLGLLALARRRRVN